MYGVVLEGGGAKGAYQIGAYKAIKELGLTVNGVTGTSVGAINGAFIVQGDLEKAYELWHELSPEKVFKVDEEHFQELMDLDFNPENLRYFIKKLKDIIARGGLDTSLIKSILRENINEDKLRRSGMDFGMVTVSLTDLTPLELFIEDIPPKKLVDFLLASASLPSFKTDKIAGKVFIDGGFYNNLPIQMLIKKGYKDFVAIRTYSLGIVRKVEEEDVSITFIKPSERLGNLLDFRTSVARKNLQLGYFDALKVFKKLLGRKYYIEPTQNEEYFRKLLLNLDESTVLRLGEILGFGGFPLCKMLIEKIVPEIFYLLHLPSEASYEELFILLMEELAFVTEINRFSIYSFKEYCGNINSKLNVSHWLPPERPTFRDKKDKLVHAAYLILKDCYSKI